MYCIALLTLLSGVQARLVNEHSAIWFAGNNSRQGPAAHFQSS
jgi:hypothetical protein